MASIDSMLGLIRFKSADALVIVSNKVPLLRKSGESLSLSMPALSKELVDTFVDEVVPDDRREVLLSEGTLTTTYSSAAGERYTAKVEVVSDGYKLVFRQGGSATPAKSQSTAAPPHVAIERPTGGVRDDSDASDHREIESHRGLNQLDSQAKPEDPSFRSMLINFCLEAQRQEASDIFLTSGSSAHLRVGGMLQEAPYVVCSEKQILELLRSSMGDAHLATLEKAGSTDFSFEEAVEEGRLLFRVNLFRSERGLAAVLRPIEQRIPTLEELGLPSSFRDLVGFPSGLVLMTGQAGSGKSTTLAALIEHVNLSRPAHVITLEDPIEYRYEDKRCLIQQREVGRHVESFSAGLRSALREAPDIILVGEMRDLTTISSALTAAETGHLVLSTLHCGSASMAIDRIIDVFPGHQQPQIRSQLASALRAVVTQVLLPSLTPGKRVPAFEKLVVTDAVATKIRESRGHQLVTEIQTGRVEGMVSLERSLASLVQSGQIALETALSVANDRDGLTRLVKGMKG